MRPIYFERPGPVNTAEVINVVRKKLKISNIDAVVIASISGNSAVLLGEKIRDLNKKIICVACPPGMYIDLENTENTPYAKIKELIEIKERCLKNGIKKYPLELTPENKKKLAELGIEIVRTATPYFGVNLSIRSNLGFPTYTIIISKVLELFCPGTSACSEVVMMATDAGKVKHGKEVIATAGTERGFDTSYVMRASTSDKIFDRNGLRFLELICKPRIAVNPDTGTIKFT